MQVIGAVGVVSHLDLEYPKFITSPLGAEKLEKVHSMAPVVAVARTRADCVYWLTKIAVSESDRDTVDSGNRANT